MNWRDDGEGRESDFCIVRLCLCDLVSPYNRYMHEIFREPQTCTLRDIQLTLHFYWESFCHSIASYRLPLLHTVAL